MVRMIPVFVTFACCMAVSFLPAKADVVEPNAAELVRAVRRSEMWMHHCESLYIRVQGRWTRTPESVATWRARIEEEFGVRDPDPRQFPNVRATVEQSLEFAVDRRRVRYLKDDPGYWRSVRVWDGNELRSHSKYYHRAQEHYMLDRDISQWTFHELFPCNYGWPRSQPHSFWYDIRDVNDTMEFYGPAEHFKLIGRELYRGIPCYVLEYEVPAQRAAGLTWRWFVGRSDGLLYGIQARRPDQSNTEHWWSDYREIVPGGWFPRKSSWYFREPDEAGRMQISSTCNLEVVEFRVNEPLPDELFVLPIEPGPDGVEVVDERSGRLDVYKVYRPWPSLLGKEADDFAGIGLASAPAKGKPLLIVFVDLEQRPSRRVLQELAASGRASLRERIDVVPIQVDPMASASLNEWREKLSLPWEIVAVTDDLDKVRRSWGAKSLPWLILTDRDHIVRAEGFALAEIDGIIAGMR